MMNFSPKRRLLDPEHEISSCYLRRGIIHPSWVIRMQDLIFIFCIVFGWSFSRFSFLDHIFKTWNKYEVMATVYIIQNSSLLSEYRLFFKKPTLWFVEIYLIPRRFCENERMPDGKYTLNLNAFQQMQFWKQLINTLRENRSLAAM